MEYTTTPTFTSPRESKPSSWFKSSNIVRWISRSPLDVLWYLRSNFISTIISSALQTANCKATTARCTLWRPQLIHSSVVLVNHKTTLIHRWEGKWSNATYILSGCNAVRLLSTLEHASNRFAAASENIINSLSCHVYSCIWVLYSHASRLLFMTCRPHTILYICTWICM